MQETACQSRVNTARPRHGAQGRGHSRASAQMSTFRSGLRRIVSVCPPLEAGGERVQITSEVRAAGAESLEGQVRASALKSPG